MEGEEKLINWRGGDSVVVMAEDEDCPDFPSSSFPPPLLSPSSPPLKPKATSATLVKSAFTPEIPDSTPSDMDASFPSVPKRHDRVHSAPSFGELSALLFDKFPNVAPAEEDFLNLATPMMDDLSDAAPTVVEDFDRMNVIVDVFENFEPTLDNGLFAPPTMALGFRATPASDNCFAAAPTLHDAVVVVFAAFAVAADE